MLGGKHIFALERNLLRDQFFKGVVWRLKIQNLTMLWSWLLTLRGSTGGWVL